MKASHKTIRQALQQAIHRGQTQTQIAKAIGVSQGTIYKYLTGEPNPDLDTIIKFSKWLHISLDELLLGHDHGRERIAESASPYRLSSQRLLELVTQLDQEEVATLERCAEAFTIEDEAVRNHLIGQLKLIERIIRSTKPAKVRGHPQKDQGSASHG